jgi:hypothetical protein
LARASEAALAKIFRQSLGSQHPSNGIGESPAIVRLKQEPRIAGDFREGAGCRDDDWHTKRHCLEDRQAEPFMV